MNHDLFFHAANVRALGSDPLPRVWTVSQVNAVSRELVEGSLPPLWVEGEVSGFRRLRSGHCFFTLKDARAQIGCVMWRDAARRLPAEPPEGMRAHVFGYPSIYERAGRFQFVVAELSARGEGVWRSALEGVRRRLDADGLLDPARKRAIPRCPDVVGVVTSPQGAAIRDIVSVIHRRAPWVHICVYPTRVQGDEAVAGILRAIRATESPPRADVLIIGRGGGSVEDLWVFNDERVARAIAGSALPVISAIGHETDVTLADLVADHRAPTPSAAAETAVPDGRALRQELGQLGERLSGAATDSLRRVADCVVALEERLTSRLGRLLEDRRHRVELLGHRLRVLGPQAVLERGYSVAQDSAGNVLRNADRFVPGMDFRLRLQDGSVRARVVEREEDPGEDERERE